MNYWKDCNQTNANKMDEYIRLSDRKPKHECHTKRTRKKRNLFIAEIKTFCSATAELWNDEIRNNRIIIENTRSELKKASAVKVV